MKDIFLALDDIGAETQESLKRFLDNEEMYLKYIRAFPEEPSMASLQTAVAEEDYDAAEKSVHALKGIVKNLGFVPLADATVDMLAELRDGDTEAALDAFKDVEKQYECYCGVIKRWREQD